MPVRTLRQKYNVAYTAYQSCVTAINDALRSNTEPKRELLDRLDAATQELNEARDRLLYAMQETGEWQPIE